MLQCYAPLRLNRLRFLYIFQQDGALPHSSIETRRLLNINCPNGWIGRGSEIGRPSYSPDLTPCDFFLWSQVNSMVYASPIISIQELKSRITSAIRSIDRNMLRKVWENTKIRLHYIITTRGNNANNINLADSILSSLNF